MLRGATVFPDDVAARYRREGVWLDQTFGQLLRGWARANAERTALVCGARRLSYAELDDLADRLAAGLSALGIRPRDRVLVQLPNVAEFAVVCFALFRLGALPVLALPAHRKSEIVHLCQLSQAVAYVIPDVHGGFDYRQLADETRRACTSLAHVLVVGDPHGFRALDSLYGRKGELPEPPASEVALFQLSGGTTGIPKLIPRTHEDYAYSVRRSAELCRLDEHSVYLAALPVAHNFPLSSPGVLGTLHAGGRVVLAPNGSPEACFQRVSAERVTITALVPPLVGVWLEAVRSMRPDLSSLHVLQVGGARLSASVAARVRAELGCTLQQVFGMAEGLVNYTRLDDPEEVIVRTQGRPMSSLDEVRVVDDEERDVAPGGLGQLLTRGPYTIRGYYRADEHNARAFTADGFYKTGDLVRVDAGGNLTVEGRTKDLVNRGGDKVSAEEVENHLRAHPGVREVALVAMPDGLLGERSCAYVVAGADVPSLTGLKTFLRTRGLAEFKLPDRMELIDALPVTAVGKIDKAALRERISKKLSSSRSAEGSSK